MGILSGKVAIVTGAGRGLGVAEAMALAKEGADITVCSRTIAEVRQTADTVQALGRRAHATACDVRDTAAVQRVVDETVERFGRIDILVNNAQMVFGPQPIEDWTETQMRATWESGPLASWSFMNACFPHFQSAGGRIINFCSPAGHGKILGYAGYSMAKEAIRSLTRCAAREWGRHRITVNAISPIAMSSAARERYAEPAQQEALLEQFGAALRQFGDAESDVGRAVVYLAGPDGKHITGCTLSVDGGAAMI